MAEYFIGLMSGTSLDGIDACLVEFGSAGQLLNLVACHHVPFSVKLKALLSRLIYSQDLYNAAQLLDNLGQADVLLANEFSAASLVLLQQANITASVVRAIGCHGQTVRHGAMGELPFSLQIGNPHVLMAQTGIPVVADFRRGDIAAGGQGAPLAPAFHRAYFSSDQQARVVLNIGGIANITVLNHNAVIGFDTGPGNALLDAWIAQCLQQPYDQGGQWAASGQVNEALLFFLLSSPYFSMPAPKSTGKELFNLQWLTQQLMVAKTQGILSTQGRPQDIQATLAALTALSSINMIDRYTDQPQQVVLCGGGAHNHYLRDCFARYNTRGHAFVLSDDYGLSVDWVEAVAFAWLAKQRMDSKLIDLRTVTGATESCLLGVLVSNI